MPQIREFQQKLEQPAAGRDDAGGMRGAKQRDVQENGRQAGAKDGSCGAISTKIWAPV